MSAAEPIEITIFRKSDGPLTKRIQLGPDGQVKSDGSQCLMPCGVARRFVFYTMRELATEIERFGSDEALGTGVIRPDLPDIVRVIARRWLNGVQPPDVIARTQEFISFRDGVPSIVLLDFDLKGMPETVAQRLQELGGFWGALVKIIPEIENVGRVERASTSTGLYDSQTGRKFPNSGGRHIYLLIKNGADSERLLKTLHQRCWLSGLGWATVGKAGQLLDRSIVDRFVGTPERLAFEGPPCLFSRSPKILMRAVQSPSKENHSIRWRPVARLPRSS